MNDFRKLCLLSIFSILFTSQIFSQTNQRELGLRFSSLDSFSFIYKKAKNENVLTRFRLGLIGMNYNRFSENNDAFNIRIALAIGREKRKNIASKLQFIHGWEPNLLIHANFPEGSDYVIQFNPGIGYVFGFQYNFSKHFYVNIETIPGLSARFQIDETGFDDRFSLNAGFNSGAVAISVLYRFEKS